MSAAAVSILIFGIYLILNAAGLLFAPNLLLQVVGLPPTNDIWIRILGIVVLVVGLYYVQAAREEATPFFRWTTWGRPLVLAGLLGFVLARMAPPAMLGFGVIDTAGAVWTALALRRGSPQPGRSS